MKPAEFTTRTRTWVVRVAGVLVLAVLGVAGLLPDAAGNAPQQDQPKKPTGSEKEKAPPTVEVRFTDDSTMKLALVEQKLELDTPHGKLSIPVADIRQIDFGWRIPEEDAKRIDAAITDLASMDFNRRKAASEELAAQGLKAYPALLKAAKANDPEDKANANPDREVFRRVNELLEKLRQTVPAEKLEIRTHDVVHTEQSKIAGQLTSASIKVKTFQFGDQQVKLAHLRSLAIPGAVEDVPADALPDPGHLVSLAQNIGKTYTFKVTGAQPGRGGVVYGSGGVHTVDSTLALAVVHGGILKPGQTGYVKVTILGNVAGFQGTTENGITSHSYGQYPAYRLTKYK